MLLQYVFVVQDVDFVGMRIRMTRVPQSLNLILFLMFSHVMLHFFGAIGCSRNDQKVGLL